MPARLTGLANTIFQLSLSLCLALSLLGCGAGAQRANVKVGTMPEGGTFTGVWFSPQYGEMHMVQNGATVVGRYQKEERRGRIQGGVEGDVMRFEWNEKRELIIGHATNTKGRGFFRLVKDDQEDTWKLVGEWGNDAAETGGGPWNAVKSKTRRPDVDGSGGEAEESSSGSDSSSDSSEESDSETGGSDDLSNL